MVRVNVRQEQLESGLGSELILIQNIQGFLLGWVSLGEGFVLRWPCGFLPYHVDFSVLY